MDLIQKNDPAGWGGGGTWTFHDSNEQKIANIFSSKKIYCAFLEK